MTFVHVSIRAKDMDESIRFYEHHFGMILDRRNEIAASKAEIAFLKSADAKFALEITWYKEQKEFKQAEYEDRAWDHLAFTVHDIKTTIEDMRKEGVVITDEPFELFPGGPLLAFIEDPVGVLIELIERK